MKNLHDDLQKPGQRVIAGAPEGLDALALAQIARGRRGGVLHLATSDVHLQAMAQALAFFAPDVNVVSFPAWDCMPYDRISPSSVILSQRMAALARLAGTPSDNRVVLTTVRAALQRLPKIGRAHV